LRWAKSRGRFGRKKRGRKIWRTIWGKENIRMRCRNGGGKKNETELGGGEKELEERTEGVIGIGARSEKKMEKKN
jgi:hypothetical protein